MADNTESIGGVSVSITGDASGLGPAFTAAQSQAQQAGTAVANSFNVAAVAADRTTAAVQSLAQVIRDESIASTLAAQRNLESALAFRAAEDGANRAAQGVRGAGQAAHGAVPEMAAASGAIRTAFGEQSIRAVERFATSVLGLGPLFQAAFPLIGALALVEMVTHLVGRFGELTEAEKKAEEETKRVDEAWNKLADDFDRGEVEKATAAISKLAGTKVKRFFDESEAQRDRAMLKSLTDDLVLYKQRAQEAAAAAKFDNSSFLGQIQRLDPISGARKIVALQDWKQQQAQVESLTKQISELTEKVRLYDQVTKPLGEINQNQEAGQESGSIASARIGLQEAQLKHQSELNKAYSDEEITHARGMLRISGSRPRSANTAPGSSDGRR